MSREICIGIEGQGWKFMMGQDLGRVLPGAGTLDPHGAGLERVWLHQPPVLLRRDI
jgi:hypothetical protein